MYFDAGATRPLFVTECNSDSGLARVAGDVVTLEWDGGTTPIYPRRPFDALDLAAFETADGGTLADDPELFRELVRLQVTRIFCNAAGPAIRVRHADESGPFDGNMVYLTQGSSPVAPDQIGEGEYDPCNGQYDNAAVIFGEQIRRLGGSYTFDEWVLVFANVVAHETGHMLGYGHVTRDELPEAGRSLYVELMLDGHTMSELRREQRFVIDQTNCPDQ